LRSFAFLESTASTTLLDEAILRERSVDSKQKKTVQQITVEDEEEAGSTLCRRWAAVD